MTDTDAAFSIPNQAERHALAMKNKVQRVLNIEAIYDPSYFNNKVVLVTGGNRGLGRAIVEQLIEQGVQVIVTVRQPVEIPGSHLVISGVDVTDNQCGTLIAQALKKHHIQLDVLINNAGYFYEPVETLTSLNFTEQLKMIDVCALGPLRVSSVLYQEHLFKPKANIAIISSQGGSIAWRKIQNPQGCDYGHHMSKAAANMMSVLLSQELMQSQIVVAILHPGFNKTDMTKKYESIWQEEGAVDPSIGAKRVLHEISGMNLDKTGTFINCEDGLQIPW